MSLPPPARRPPRAQPPARLQVDPPLAPPARRRNKRESVLGSMLWQYHEVYLNNGHVRKLSR